MTLSTALSHQFCPGISSSRRGREQDNLLLLLKEDCLPWMNIFLPKMMIWQQVQMLVDRGGLPISPNPVARHFGADGCKHAAGVCPLGSGIGDDMGEGMAATNELERLYRMEALRA